MDEGSWKTTRSIGRVCKAAMLQLTGTNSRTLGHLYQTLSTAPIVSSPSRSGRAAGEGQQAKESAATGNDFQKAKSKPITTTY